MYKLFNVNFNVNLRLFLRLFNYALVGEKNFDKVTGIHDYTSHAFPGLVHFHVRR